jgi:hypothetical protein
MVEVPAVGDRWSIDGLQAQQPPYAIDRCIETTILYGLYQNV